jgi:hypothetical protein
MGLTVEQVEQRVQLMVQMRCLAANLAAAGFGEACKQQGIAIGRAAGLLKAKGKRP